METEAGRGSAINGEIIVSYHRSCLPGRRLEFNLTVFYHCCFVLGLAYTAEVARSQSDSFIIVRSMVNPSANVNLWSFSYQSMPDQYAGTVSSLISVVTRSQGCETSHVLLTHHRAPYVTLVQWSVVNDKTYMVLGSEPKLTNDNFTTPATPDQHVGIGTRTLLLKTQVDTTTNHDRHSANKQRPKHDANRTNPVN